MSHTFVTDFGRVSGNYDLSGDLSIKIRDTFNEDAKEIVLTKANIVDLYNFVIGHELAVALEKEIGILIANGDNKTLATALAAIKKSKEKPLHD